KVLLGNALQVGDLFPQPRTAWSEGGHTHSFILSSISRAFLDFPKVAFAQVFYWGCKGLHTRTCSPEAVLVTRRGGILAVALYSASAGGGFPRSEGHDCEQTEWRLLVGARLEN